MPSGIYIRTKPSWNKGKKHSEETKRKIGLANKGKIISEEHKKRLSLFHKGKRIWKIHPRGMLGKKISEEIKRKMSEAHKKAGNGKWMKGRKLPLKTRMKMSKNRKGEKHHFFGKKFSIGHRKKLSISHIGKMTKEKSHLWKGGITPINQKIRSSFEFRLWREAVFERDKFLCQMPDCDKTERYLNAHHIKKFSDYSDLRFDVNNGITLCKKCHNKIKGKEEQFEQLFLEIIKELLQRIPKK